MDSAIVSCLVAVCAGDLRDAARVTGLAVAFRTVDAVERAAFFPVCAIVTLLVLV